MNRRAAWTYSTATAHAGMHAGISVVTISGIVTPRVAAQILADNARWLCDEGALAQVASYWRLTLRTCWYDTRAHEPA